MSRPSNNNPNQKAARSLSTLLNIEPSELGAAFVELIIVVVVFVVGSAAVIFFLLSVQYEPATNAGHTALQETLQMPIDAVQTTVVVDIAKAEEQAIEAARFIQRSLDSEVTACVATCLYNFVQVAGNWVLNPMDPLTHDENGDACGAASLIDEVCQVEARQLLITTAHDHRPSTSSSGKRPAKGIQARMAIVGEPQSIAELIVDGGAIVFQSLVVGPYGSLRATLGGY